MLKPSEVNLSTLSPSTQSVGPIITSHFFPSHPVKSTQSVKAAVVDFNLKSTQNYIPGLQQTPQTPQIPQRFCFSSCKELLSPSVPRRGHNAGSTVAKSAGCGESTRPALFSPPIIFYWTCFCFVFFTFCYLKELKVSKQLLTFVMLLVRWSGSCLHGLTRRSRLGRKVRPTKRPPPSLSLSLSLPPSAHQSICTWVLSAVHKVNIPPPEVPAHIYTDLKSSWSTNVRVFLWNARSSTGAGLDPPEQILQSRSSRPASGG